MVPITRMSFMWENTAGSPDRMSFMWENTAGSPDRMSFIGH